MENPAGLPGYAGAAKTPMKGALQSERIIGKPMLYVALGVSVGLVICQVGPVHAKISGSLGISPWKLPFKEVIYVRGHKNRWQTVSCCRWRKN